MLFLRQLDKWQSSKDKRDAKVSNNSKIIKEIETMEKKFELTEEFIINNSGIKLYRIKALKDFSDVKKGDLGGYVQQVVAIR